MPRMQFHFKNLITDSAQLTVTSGGGSTPNMVDRQRGTKWTSSGENSDANTASISWVAPSSTIIESVMLINHNFKSFNVIYNSGAANQFSPGLSITGNVLSNLFYMFGSQAVSSIDINCWETHVTNAEKFVGEWIISYKMVELDTNPNSTGYKPVKYKKGIEHELADGGITSVFLSQKFRASIDLPFINSQTYNSLTAIYDQHMAMTFVPFPQNTFTAAWNGEAWPVNWIGDLDIDTLYNNAADGYIGSINLAQIPD